MTAPTRDQILAADPERSAWVGANAGSGKTRVLTQRVARLLLGGARPERVLCLTYTKAAAAEMQTRLFQTLGEWAMAPDATLASELAALEGHDRPDACTTRLAMARRLFAAALETPGGLKIQTIHAFCDSLLRRFPLEAAISPRFEVADDRQQVLMTEAILAAMAEEAENGTDPAFDGVARRLDEGGIESLVAAILSRRADVEAGSRAGTVRERIAAHLGPEALASPHDVAVRRLAALDRDSTARLADAMASHGGKADQQLGPVLRAALAKDAAEDAARAIMAVFLTQKQEPRSRTRFPTKAVLAAAPWADAATDDLIAWSTETRDAFRAAEAAQLAIDLDAFASGFLNRYKAAKEARGLLDFDDLVARTRDLLTRSELAQWALYKLDGGIDHILIDEAQDTAPAQWDVIRAIIAEFYAGAGARGGARSLFVVGDEKQSIYSFQGAEPRAFGSTREGLASWLDGMGRRLERPALATSFRSAPGVLEFVDAVFAGDVAHGLTVDDIAVSHQAHRAEDGARIDLWPLLAPEPGPEDEDWWRPIDQPPRRAPKLRLARILAAEIQRMVANDRRPAKNGAPGARVRPGDILVLVAKRDLLAESLIRALKSAGVPVAGADRLTLAGELAVKDLMALVRIALTPGDDLTLAALLRSPMMGVSEEALFALAQGRGRRIRLIDRLRRAARDPETAQSLRSAHAMIEDMAAQADFLRPFEFLQRALIRHDARRRLIARLGAEAEDPIDELLDQALSFEARETPSLAAFAAWIEAGDIKVKREMDQSAGEVRVMTIHGAKGLEAPIVILPDTMADPARGATGRQRIATIGSESASAPNSPADAHAARHNLPPLMLWDRGRESQTEPLAHALEALKSREADERKRLLYVALTRAEDWLILCGAGDPGVAERTWYGLMSDGAERLEGWVDRPGPVPDGLPGPIRRLERPGRIDDDAGHADEVTAAAIEQAREDAGTPEATHWLARAKEERRAHRLTPTGLAPHDAAPGGGAGLGRDIALLYGSAVHLVLERLANEAPETRRRLAPALLAEGFGALDDGLRAAALAEAEAVLEAPFAAELFGPESRGEVTLAGTLLEAEAGRGGQMLGRIDRLVVTPRSVIAVDFKTDALPPSDPGAVRAAYLAQIGAYRRVLATIWTDRPVQGAILWTAGPKLMHLAEETLERALDAALGPLRTTGSGGP